MSSTKKVLGNTLVQVVGRFTMAIISVVVVKIMTNYLGKAGYGEYAAIYDHLTILAIMADMGLFVVGVREMAKSAKEKVGMIMGNIFTIRFILGLLMIVVAVISAYVIPPYQDTRVPFGIVIASFAVFFTMMQGTVATALQYKLKMQYSTIGLVLGKLISFGLIVYVIFKGFTAPSDQGFYAILVAGVIGAFFMFAITFFFANRHIKIRFRLDRSFVKDVFIKSIPYGLALILSTIYFRIDSLMLFWMKDAAEVGIYAVPMRILEIVAAISLYFMNSVLPILAYHIKEKTDKVKSIVQHSFNFLTFTSLPIIVGTFMLAYPLIFIISNEDFLTDLSVGFYGSDMALKILIVAIFFAYINNLFTYLIIATNHQNKMLAINGIGAIFNIVANIFFIEHWGFRGAAFTTILTEVILLTISYIVARKYVKLRLNMWPTIKALVSAGLMGLVIWWLYLPLYNLHIPGLGAVENLAALIMIPLGALVYALGLLITKAVNLNEMKAVLRRG